MNTPKLLLTGRPGIGKTTVVTRTLARLHEIRASGFVTRELRGPRGRLGFEAITLEGRRQTLAHVEFDSRFRVGRYGVDVEGFEREIVSSVDPDLQWAAHLLVVDEIGKMECFSSAFRDVVRRALQSQKPLLGTIARSGTGFIAEVRSRGDVTLVDVTPASRELLPEQLAERFRSVLARGQGVGS